jgi:hypothetical protein
MVPCSPLAFSGCLPAKSLRITFSISYNASSYKAHLHPLHPSCLTQRIHATKLRLNSAQKETAGALRNLSRVSAKVMRRLLLLALLSTAWLTAAAPVVGPGRRAVTTAACSDAAQQLWAVDGKHPSNAPACGAPARAHVTKRATRVSGL